MRIALPQRSNVTEFMDTEAVSLEEYRACREDLARVNSLTLAHRPILAWLDRATRDMGLADRITILDEGYGYGDLLRRISQFRRSDWERIVRKAGLAPSAVTIRRHMPFRMCVSRLK
jgi:hypothetical protein